MVCRVKIAAGIGLAVDRLYIELPSKVQELTRTLRVVLILSQLIILHP